MRQTLARETKTKDPGPKRLVNVAFSLKYPGTNHNFKQIVELSLPADTMVIVKDDFESRGSNLDLLLDLFRAQAERCSS